MIATYYAAKQEPTLDDSFVDELRDVVHEYTNHVDTRHPETLADTLRTALDDDSK